MVHPFQRIAAKRRAEGKLASKKEIKATRDFYDLADDSEDKVIIEENRAMVQRTFFRADGRCVHHHRLGCTGCMEKLKG